MAAAIGGQHMDRYPLWNVYIFPPATTCINFYRKEQAAAILLNEQPQPELFQYYIHNYL